MQISYSRIQRHIKGCGKLFKGYFLQGCNQSLVLFCVLCDDFYIASREKAVEQVETARMVLNEIQDYLSQQKIE